MLLEFVQIYLRHRVDMDGEHHAVDALVDFSRAADGE
jgi:hypothetical protein